MESNQVPSISYATHTYSVASGGGPLFILLYIQCAMFLVNSWMKLGIEMWQLVFPTLVVVVVMVSSMVNNK